MKVSVRISAKRDLSQHSLYAGRSGSGKSTLLLTLIYSLIYKSNRNLKHSVMVVDPHGDLASSVVAFSMLEKSRIVYLSSSINSEAKTTSEHTFVFNPFSYDNSAELRYLLTESLTDCFCELLEDATLTKQMISIIRPCIATVLRIEDPAQRTLKTLHRFFLEGENLDLIELGKTSEVEQHRTFFNRWHKDEHLRVSRNSLNVKLSFFLSDQRLANMLNGVSTVSIEDAINSGAVIICNYAQGSGTFASKVMGKLTLAYLSAIMMRRHNLELQERRQLYLFIDEFSFVTPSLGTLLAQARKWGLAVGIAGQSLGQISDTTLRKTIMVNTGLKAVGLTDYQDRAAFAKEMGLSVDDLEKLRPLEFYLKRNDGRHTAFKFKVNILSHLYYLTKKEKKELLNWLVNESGQYMKVPPPAPPPPLSEAPKDVKCSKKRPDNNSQSGGGLKPAF